MFTIAELLKKATLDEIKAQMYTYLAATGVAATSWHAFAPTRTLIHVFSLLIVIVQNLVVDIVAGGFRETATGAWLRVTSKQMYGVDAIEATFALGEVVLNNTGGGVYDEDPFAITFKNSVTGKTYRNTEAVHVGALETGVVVPVRAYEVGSASNASPGEVTEIVSPDLLGVEVTNSDPIVGQDDEDDDALKLRDAESLGMLSPKGPKDAYLFVAKTPSLNGGVTVNRARLLPPPGDGTGTLVIASPAGPVAPGDVALVQLGIDEWAEPEYATTTVVSAAQAAQGYAVTAYVDKRAGVPASEIRTGIKDALVKYVNALPIGGVIVGVDPGKIFWRAVVGVAEATNRTAIFQCKLDSEDDVELAANAVATLDASSVVVNVVLT